MPDSSDGRVIQQRYRPKHTHVFDPPLTIDARLEDDNSLHPRPDRKRRVLGFDPLDERRGFQSTTDAHGISRDRRWRRRWWWRRREIDHETTSHATRNPSFNSNENSLLAPDVAPVHEA